MSLEAINEKLLQTVRVGVAVFDWENQSLSFANDAFSSIFGEQVGSVRFCDLIPDIAFAEVIVNLTGGKRYSREISYRKVRRTLVLHLSFSSAEIDGKRMIILECQNNTRIRELEAMIDSYSSMVERNTRELQREKENVEKLLLNIMPRAIYEEFKSQGVVSPQTYEDVAVLVLDFSNFAENIAEMRPASVVSELNVLFTAFDQIGEQLGCERIKTTGGIYVCTAGIDGGSGNPLQIIARAAVRFIRYLDNRNSNAETQWHCRIGIGRGKAIGSVVGVQKYVYDVFGPAVDDAVKARDLAAPFEALLARGNADALPPDLRGGSPEFKIAREAGMVTLMEQ